MCVCVKAVRAEISPVLFAFVCQRLYFVLEQRHVCVWRVFASPL